MIATPIQAQQPDPAAHVRWPAQRFYWAVIDASKLPRSPASRQLDYLFERFLPVPVETIKAMYLRLPGTNRYIACGADAHGLEEALAAGALTLAPQAWPDWLPELESLPDQPLEFDPMRFNFLAGRFQPQASRQLVRRWLVESLIFIALLSAVLVWGLERRVGDIRRETTLIEAQRAALLDEALKGLPSSSSVPPDVRLLAELRTLRQTRHMDSPLAAEADAAATLADLLARWPVDAHLLTQSISIGPGAVAIRGTLPAVADAQRVIDSFQSVEGWSVGQPTIRARKGGVELALRFTPVSMKEGSQ